MSGCIGNLCGIALKEKPRNDMEITTMASLTVSLGIVGDCRGSKKKRQVTILAIEQWEEACDELRVNLVWHLRRANLLVSRLRFGPDDTGKYLLIGDDVILEITGETKPCSRMDRIHESLQEALRKDWRGGVTCRVVSGGIINKDDDVALVEKVA